MPKPYIVKKTTQLVDLTPKGRSHMVPEHNFSLKLVDWELVVFDRAEKFVVSWFKGRFNHGKQDYGSDLPAALEACAENDRAVVYAAAPTGRTVCLSRNEWPMLLARWEAKKSTKTEENLFTADCE